MVDLFDFFKVASNISITKFHTLENSRAVLNDQYYCMYLVEIRTESKVHGVACFPFIVSKNTLMTNLLEKFILSEVGD